MKQNIAVKVNIISKSPFGPFSPHIKGFRPPLIPRGRFSKEGNTIFLGEELAGLALDTEYQIL
jgi:hypothetical protein